MHIVLATRRLRQEDREFEERLHYIANLSQKKKEYRQIGQ